MALLFGQYAPTEIKDNLASDFIEAADGIGLLSALPPVDGLPGFQPESVDREFPAHDARRRRAGKPSLRWEEDFEDDQRADKPSKPSKEEEDKIRTYLTELAGSQPTTTSTTTTTTTTEYTWRISEWEKTQVQTQPREKRTVSKNQNIEIPRLKFSNGRYDVTNDQSSVQNNSSLLNPSQSVISALSTLVLIMGINIIVNKQYPAEIEPHIVSHCGWISSDTLNSELTASSPTCRMFKEEGIFIHCRNLDNNITCQLPVSLVNHTNDPLLTRANITGRMLKDAGLGLNPDDDDDYTPIRRQLQVQVDKVYEELQDEAVALTKLDEGLLEYSQRAVTQLRTAVHQEPQVMQKVYPRIMETLEVMREFSTLQTEEVGRDLLSYLNLRTASQPSSSTNIQAIRRAAMFMNEFMRDNRQEEWNQGLQDLWNYFHQQDQHEDLGFDKDDLLTAMNQLEDHTQVDVEKRRENEDIVEASDRNRRSRPGSTGPIDTWETPNYNLTDNWWNDTPRSQALSAGEKWDNMRHGIFQDDGSGPSPTCGPSHPDAPPGRIMECDRFSSRPCCSGNGVCGFSRSHCSCHYCADYRPSNYNEVRAARGLPRMEEWWTDDRQQAHKNTSLLARLTQGEEYSDVTGPDISMPELDSQDQDAIKEAIRRGRTKVMLRLSGSLGQRWSIEEEHEGTVTWTHKRTLLEYEDVASVVIVDDLGPIINALDRIADYHKKSRVTFTSDPENASHRKSPIYYTNLGIRSPYSLYNDTTNATLFSNLSQDISSGWAERKKYSRVPFWTANDAIIEEAAREAGICLESIVEAIELFHPELDEESKLRMKRQVLSLLMAGVGAALGISGLGAGLAAVSQSAANYASIEKISTRLNSVQAGVYTISKRQQMELTTEHAILKVLDDMAANEKEGQRENLALVAQNLLVQSKNRACKKAEDTVRHLEVLRKNTLPLGLITQDLLEGALAKIKNRAFSVGLYPSVATLTDFLKLPTKSLIVRTKLTSEEKKNLYQDHFQAVEELDVKKFYEDNNITTSPRLKTHFDNHHNETGKIKLESDGPGLYHPGRVLLEVKSEIPLIRSGQEVFYVKSLELGLIKINDGNQTNYFVLQHDDWVAISKTGHKMFQLRKDYFDNCVQNQDHYVCPRAPRPPSDDCLVNLLNGREDKTCLRKMIALDGHHPYLVRDTKNDRTALAYVPNNYNVILRCPAPVRIASNLTLEWTMSRDDKKGLLKLKAPFLYCSIHLAKNGEPSIGPSLYFLPNGPEEKMYLGEETTMKHLWTLLGIFDVVTGELKKDTGYSKSLLEAKQFLARANISMQDLDDMESLMPWDLLQLDSSSVKLAVSVATLAAALTFGLLCCCGWYHCRKNAKKTKMVRTSLQRDRALRSAASEASAQALLTRNQVRFV